MPRYKLFVVENEEEKIIGLVPEHNLEWAEDYDSKYIPGISAIAHDLFDHCGKRETGTIEDELAAIGGLLFRTEFYRFYDVENRLVSFRADIASSMIQSDWRHLRSCPYKVRVNPEDMKEIKYLVMGIKNRLKKEYEDCHFVDSEVSFKEWWSLNKVDMINWIRYGFRRSQKKYKIDNYSFFRLSEKLDGEFENFFSQYSDEIEKDPKFTADLKIDFKYWGIEFKANENLNC